MQWPDEGPLSEKLPPVTTQELLAHLAADLGAENMQSVAEAALPSLPSWGARAGGVVKPATSTEVSLIVRAAQAAETALIPLGGGTRIQTGYPPQEERPFLFVSTARLDRVIDYQPDDLTVTVEPGVTLTHLQTLLAEHGQFLALDTPYPERATLGGIVAANAVGFRRVAYGAPRDLLIGMRAVISEGVEIQGGGRVVKNVAGYDVCKLFTGAWGTAGILTELTFKVRPLPETSRTLTWTTPDLTSALHTGLTLHHARLAPTFLLSSNELDSAPNLIVGLEGTAARVAWQAEEFGRRIAAAGIRAQPQEIPVDALKYLRNRQARLHPDTPLAARIACLPTELEALAASLETLPNLSLTVNCGDGTLSLATSTATAELVIAIRSRLPKHANITWIRLDLASADTQDIPRWGETREDFALQCALKQAIDPHQTFSPGRFLGRL